MVLLFKSLPLRRLAVVGLAVFGMGQALAAWPDKPIRIVVAFPPGATTDIIARTFSAPLSEALGQPVVIENRPGAGGNIATVAVARSPADGYTFLMHSVAYAVNPSLYAKAGYEVGKDLSAVAITGVSPNILFVHPGVKANTLAELLALAKTEKLSYASSGNGTTTHLGAELRIPAAPDLDAVSQPCQSGCAACALFASGSGQRSGQRPGAFGFHLGPANGPTGQSGQSAAHCRHQCAPQRRFARCAHRGRIGLPRL